MNYDNRYRNDVLRTVVASYVVYVPERLVVENLLPQTALGTTGRPLKVGKGSLEAGCA